MRYIRKQDADRNGFTALAERCGSISVTGSVRGMRKLYGWPAGGQVRIGAWVYNVGPDAVQRAGQLGILRG